MFVVRHIDSSNIKCTSTNTHSNPIHNGMWIEHYESDLNFLVVMSWHCMFLQYFLSVFLSIGVIVATQLFLYNLHCACILCVVYGRFLFNFLQGLYDCFAIVFDFDRSLRIHMRMWVCICKCHHVYCFVVTFVKYARKERTKKKYTVKNKRCRAHKR